MNTPEHSDDARELAKLLVHFNDCTDEKSSAPTPMEGLDEDGETALEIAISKGLIIKILQEETSPNVFVKTDRGEDERGVITAYYLTKKGKKISDSIIAQVKNLLD